MYADLCTGPAEAVYKPGGHVEIRDTAEGQLNRRNAPSEGGDSTGGDWKERRKRRNMNASIDTLFETFNEIWLGRT